MEMKRFLKYSVLAAFLALVIIRRGRAGRFLGVPYDFRLPTAEKLRERLWNPGDERILTPHVFGWGYSVNFYALGRRLGLLP